MYFSEAFGIEPTKDDDWFDPLLEIDTKLFVDPFLIYKEESGFWADSGARFAKHFEIGFRTLAGFQDRRTSLQYMQTVDLMLFPEPREFGLGFASHGTRGSGTGRDFAEKIVKAMSEAIKRGLEDMKHFEELGLLVDGIAEDRISDITCNILKSKFITYTQEIAHRHDIPMEKFMVRHAMFDFADEAWVDTEVLLPKNPETGEFILLTPKRFLRELPTLSSDDWKIYFSHQLKHKLNLHILRKMPKREIVALARKHADTVRDWTKARELLNPAPYDVDKDPKGYHNWQAITRGFALTHPLPVNLVSAFNLDDFIEFAIGEFKHHIEQGGGWKTLWNDQLSRPKPEENIQLVFMGVLMGYCHAYSVRMERETNFGTGPVDFVFSNTSERILLEIKKMSSSSFWNGMVAQLTAYLTSARCSKGWYLAIRFKDTPLEKNRVLNLASRTANACVSTGFSLKSEWIDARVQISASHRKATSTKAAPPRRVKKVPPRRRVKKVPPPRRSPRAPRVPPDFS